MLTTPRLANTLFGANWLKLRVFCTNDRRNPGSAVPEARTVNWPTSLQVGRIADEAGHEEIVPLSHSDGHVATDPDHIGGGVLDPSMSAAATTQTTHRVGIFVTSHAQTIHPIMVARQLATMDIISGQRVALNVVSGWNRPELEMFGAAKRKHDERYDYLAEWFEVAERLWSSDNEFVFAGEFFRIMEGISGPTPRQYLRSLIMTVGASTHSTALACEHAELAFVVEKFDNPTTIRAEIDGYKQLGRERFGCEVQVWTYVFVVQRSTQREADQYRHHYALVHQDQLPVDGWIEMQLQEAQLRSPHVLESMRARFAMSYGGHGLVGIADRPQRRAQCHSFRRRYRRSPADLNRTRLRHERIQSRWRIFA